VEKSLVCRLFSRPSACMKFSGNFPEFLFGGSAVVPGLKRGLGAMRNHRITKRLVDNLKATGKEYFVWDETTIGFGVRVQAGGPRPTW
jgi:hypothetical protein